MVGTLRRPLFNPYYKILGLLRVVNVHFAKYHAALAQKLLCPAAIAAPHRPINSHFDHSKEVPPRQNKKTAESIVP